MSSLPTVKPEEITNMEQMLLRIKRSVLPDCTSQELLEMFLHVSRCWKDRGDLSVREEMTVERAILILRAVRDQAAERKLRRIADTADSLMWAIVFGQTEPREENEDVVHHGNPIGELVDQDQIAVAV